MIDYNSQFEVAHDLERRLAPRRAIEAAMRSGGWKHAHKDSLVLRDHITRPILRTALKIAGVYARGTRNALQLVVRHLRLEFEDLPESFDGFRILHLTDLHIDGVDGLAEIVAERIAGLHADLCVMTGDYRYEIRGTVRHSLFAPADDSLKRRSPATALPLSWAITTSPRWPGNSRISACGCWSTKRSRSGGEEPACAVIGVDDPHCYGCDDLDGALEGVPRGCLRGFTGPLARDV